MSKLIRVLALAASMLAGGPALAQDAQPFTGARVEGTVGWDQVRFDLGSYGGSGRTGSDALGYGFELGYDKALSPTLIGGVDAGMSFADADTRVGTTLNGGALHRRREVDAGVRLGTPLGENALLYGKIGYSNLEIRRDRTVAGVTSSNLYDLDGVQLGAGAEVRVSPKVYLKSEYRYTDYAKDYNANQVLTGLGIRF